MLLFIVFQHFLASRRNATFLPKVGKTGVGKQVPIPRSTYCTIPLQVLWAVNSEVLRWVLLALGTGSSGAVLVLSLWKPLRTDSSKQVTTPTPSVLLITSPLSLLHASW